MARALLIHERTSTGSWKPVSVLFATPKRLDVRTLPGSGSRDAYINSIIQYAKPPYKDGVGISMERGTWEDWIDWANRSLGNGHDTWVTEIEPDVTLEATYGQYVLGADTALTSAKAQPTDVVPELSGYRKVKQV